MKIITCNLLLFALFCSCSQKVSRPVIEQSPIMDYSENYHQEKNYVDTIIKKQNEQTIVLIDNKVFSLTEFNQLLEKDKIKILKIIKDKEDIEQLKYSYTKIKTIIIAKWK
ncbi:hypothetical protein [Elizabethkingia anophelis]|uniref:hypothetical protein n=1 Tax=Elizabethkingia anophelis TaxID=1117645 RepID=UPI00293C7C92|nr:hypothetical protein [Elizabethkingia anophelis]